MRLSEHLCRDCVVAELAARNKEQVLRELAAKAATVGLDENAVLGVLLDRERLGSTAVGEGIAIPHGKLSGLNKMALFFARSSIGVDFDAPDKKPCRLFFMVLAPEEAAGQHLGMLGAIVRLGKDGDFAYRLLQAKDNAELISFLSAV